MDTARPVVETDRLTHFYGPRVALHEFTLSVTAGEAFARHTGRQRLHCPRPPAVRDHRLRALPHAEPDHRPVGDAGLRPSAGQPFLGRPAAQHGCRPGGRRVLRRTADALGVVQRGDVQGAGGWSVRSAVGKGIGDRGHRKIVAVSGVTDGDKLGTDGIGADMFEEARFAFFKGRDATALGARASRPQEEVTNQGMRAVRPRSQGRRSQALGADHWLRVLSNNHRLATEAFEADFGALSPGSAADLIALDYGSPTPLTAENLPWHFAFGMTSASVESVMVNGRFVVKDRRHALDDEVYRKARQASEKLWARLQRS